MSATSVRHALATAFSGDEYEENAAAAAGEGEWSWFRWLAVSTVANVPDDLDAADIEDLRGPLRRHLNAEDDRAFVGGSSHGLSSHDAADEAIDFILAALDARTALISALSGCQHEWLDRPESDTRECLICGDES